MKSRIISQLLALCCIVFCLLVLVTSCKLKQVPGGTKGKPYFDENTPADQLIIWRKPERTEEQFERWLSNFRKKHGAVKEQNTCGTCDNSLRVISGPGVKTFIQTDGVDGRVTAGKKSPTTGEDDTVYYCLNYRVRHKKPKIQNSFSTGGSGPQSHPGNVVKVAIFDTGLDPTESNRYAFNFPGNCCIKGAGQGWNFVGHNNDYSDDDDIKHGTVVTRFIVEQVNRYKGDKVEILPVKTHDANGYSDLYSVLCGFAYAQKMGVHVINASWGFYVPRRKLSGDESKPDPNVLLLRKYVAHYLTRNNILLVAAAGNSDNENLRKAFEDHDWPYRPNNPRDLSEVSFYPASLAGSPEFKNVIAVTTVHINKNGNGKVSPDQNFSDNVVDIGVNSDGVVGDDFVFRNPFTNNLETVEGSSFAAPIVTGILCANYAKIRDIISRKDFNKDEIWKSLGPGLVRTNPTLRDKIKDGRIMERAK